MKNAPEQSIATSSIDSITALLKANPKLFQEFPHLLDLVDLPDDRGTASLLERQVANLKSQIEEHRSHHSQLIDVARENEQISDRFSAVIYKLIGFKNLSEFATEFPAELRSVFDIDEVTFKTHEAVAKRPKDNDGYDAAVERLVNKRAVCDNRWPSAIMRLFFKQEIQSAALIPMLRPIGGADTDIIGIIALGSIDKDKYTNNLGTAHLDRLGIMTGICINRLQPQL